MGAGVGGDPSNGSVAICGTSLSGKYPLPPWLALATVLNVAFEVLGPALFARPLPGEVSILGRADDDGPSSRRLASADMDGKDGG